MLRSVGHIDEGADVVDDGWTDRQITKRIAKGVLSAIHLL